MVLKAYVVSEINRQTQSDVATGTLWENNVDEKLVPPLTVHRYPYTNTQKDTQKHNHAGSRLPPGISESSCTSSGVVVNQPFLLIDLSP